MQSKGSFFKGLGTGMAAGAAITLVAKTVTGSDKHNITKGSAKLVKAVGEVIDGIQTMFK